LVDANVQYKTSSDMKKQINDLLLKMQIGENCIGETANKLLDLYNVSEPYLFECPACEQIGAYYVTTSKDSNGMEVDHCKCKSCTHDWWE
jgi:DNA-directed RNA polymerase subunit M/transcription elongation factor TFIIS